MARRLGPFWGYGLTGEARHDGKSPVIPSGGTESESSQALGLNIVGTSGNCWSDSSPWWWRQVEALQRGALILHPENRWQLGPQMPAAEGRGGSNSNEAQVHHLCLSHYRYLLEDSSPINSLSGVKPNSLPMCHLSPECLHERLKNCYLVERNVPPSNGRSFLPSNGRKDPELIDVSVEYQHQNFPLQHFMIKIFKLKN